MSLSCTAVATGRHRTAGGRAKCPACSPRLDAPRALAAPEIFDQTALLEDRDGRLIDVRPGVIDDNAIRAYTSGQCMALAVEVACALGSDQIAVVTSWTDSTREYAQVDPEEMFVHHMWAVSPDGIDAIDIRETVPLTTLFQVFMRDVGTAVPAGAFRVISIDEALERFEFSAAQDYEVAAKFAAVINERFTPREPVTGDLRMNPDGTMQWFVGGEWTKPS